MLTKSNPNNTYTCVMHIHGYYMSLKIQFIKWHSAILEPSNLSQRAGGHWSFLSNHTGSVAARETLVVGEKGLCNCEGVEASLGSKEAAKEGWHSQGQAAVIYRMRHTTAHQIRILFSHCISLTTVLCLPWSPHGFYREQMVIPYCSAGPNRLLSHVPACM